MSDGRHVGPTRGTMARGEVLNRIRDAEDLFCFLDYDGTLAPIAPTPDEALPVAGTAELLARLAAAPGTKMAVISGRTIESVRRLLDVPGAYYVGIHGIELRRPDGSSDLTNGLGIVGVFLPIIKRQIQEELAATPGVLIEDKGAALACHYRLATESDAAHARDTVTRIARTYQRRGLAIDVLSGHAVIELRPPHVTKGTAVSSLLALSGPRVLPLYIGDDRTDEEAFAILPARAIAIHVGPSAAPQLADCFLADPDAVHEFLQEVLRARSARVAEK